MVIKLFTLTAKVTNTYLALNLVITIVSILSHPNQMTFDPSFNFCTNITTLFNGDVLKVLSVWDRTYVRGKNVMMFNFYGSLRAWLVSLSTVYSLGANWILWGSSQIVSGCLTPSLCLREKFTTSSPKYLYVVYVC